MRRNSHAHRRFLNESDFPYDIDEVLEQIEDAKRRAIKKFNKALRDFEKGEIKSDDAHPKNHDELSHAAWDIIFLNNVKYRFESGDDIDSIFKLLKANWIDDGWTSVNGWVYGGDDYVQGIYQRAAGEYNLPFLNDITDYF